MRPKMRAYSHQGHGPRADQTGRIHISDFRFLRTISLAKRSRSIHLGHKRTHAAQQMAELLNHLVGCGEQRRRDVDTELFRCFEIDDQLEPGGLHDWKVRRRFTFKYAADIDTRWPPSARQVGPIADKTSE